MSGVYIHIPFCYQRCDYCDFYSSTETARIEEFVNTLILEITQRKNYLAHSTADTIYFGGGTPSILKPKQLKSILETLKRSIVFADDTELCFEMNPDDMSREYLSRMFELGVNRISIGVQSFLDKDLVLMNRRHDAKQAEEAIIEAGKVGFDSISMDLIYGLPHQTNESWTRNLQKTFELPVQHLSAYHLSYEKGTIFHRKLRNKELFELDENQSYQQYLILLSEAEKNGFDLYEISNLSKPGFQSRHNKKYWTGEHYLGLGPSAHSYNGRQRHWNVSNLKQYQHQYKSGSFQLDSEEIDDEKRRNECLMLGLRTVSGIGEADYKQLFGATNWSGLLQKAQKQIKAGHLRYEENRLFIVKESLFLSDGIIAELFEV